MTKYLAPLAGAVFGALAATPVSLLATSVLAIHLPRHTGLPPSAIYAIVHRPALLACCAVGAAAGAIGMMLLRGFGDGHH